jgi:hypothetical protein
MTWNKESLNKDAWVKRTKDKVHWQARAWRDKVTTTDKNALATKHGVRWSPFHNMAHWDPAMHIILGYLHNWLEGILQHQLRQLWGIGCKSEEINDGEENANNKLFTEDDVT